LHNNTTPDDIPICEALLAFLKSGGDKAKYWEVLTKNGIDSARLASFERSITKEPEYAPHAIGDFENYLKILKQLHSSGDIQMLCDEARGHLGSHEHRAIDDMLSNFNDQDTLRQMDRVNLLRNKMYSYHINQS
jgi:alpha-glucan,water dikinase